MNITTEKLRPRDWTAIDSDSYDGAPDSTTNFIGRGETEEEAIEDLTDILVNKCRFHPNQSIYCTFCAEWNRRHPKEKHIMKKETKDTHIYFPVELYEALKKVAEINRRSISTEVVIAVEKHVKKENVTN